MNVQGESVNSSLVGKTGEIFQTCTVCGQSSLKFNFVAYGFDCSAEKFNLFHCNHCGITCVRPSLTSQQLQKYYQSDYYGGGELEKKSNQKFNFWIEALVRFANQSRCLKLIRYLNGHKGRILDVGCGRGNFLIAMAAKGFTCVGTDISKFEQNDNHGITFLQGTLESLSLPRNSFDAVSIWHVLEHTLNPTSTLKEISEVVKAGGVIAIAVPNYGSWQSQLFGRHWFHLDLPRHGFHFTEKSLRQMLAVEGFEIISVKTLSWDQNLFGWIQSVQNVFFYKNYPNRLYSLLKRTKVNSYPHKNRMLGGLLDLLLLGFAGILFLPALIETLVSSLFGRGATLIMYARKK